MTIADVISILLVLMLVVVVILELALLCLVMIDLIPLLPKRKREKIIKRAGGHYTVDYLNKQHTQHIYTNIITGSQSDAEKICDTLKALLDHYKKVTVADLYEASGIETTHNDLRYGWTDLGRMGIIHTHNGYLLSLPAPKLLEQGGLK